MGGSVLFSLLLALTVVPKASSTTMSSTAAGSTASTPMMSSTAAGSTASTTIMSLTTAGSTSTTAMMSSTTAGSTASTPMMGSTEAGSTASTTMESSTAAGSTASTAMMGSTAAGSTASAAMMSSTAAGSTATTAMMSSTAAGSTASATMVSSTTAATPSTTAARAPATTTTRSTAASTNATGPTDPPVLVFNGTVERLPSPISNAGCGNSLLCVGAPESCDPSKPGSCFFVGIKRTAGQNFEFSLSGESEGYIGCTLSTNSSLGGGDITFICANKDGTVEFIGASLNNSALSRKDVNANSVKGHINGNTIQCTFKATVPDATARGSATSFALAVVNGTFSPGTGDLGAPEAKVQTKVLDIADIFSSISSILNSGRPTASATMVSSTTAATPSTTAARAPATTTTRSTAASTNATGPTDPPVLVFNGTVERLPSPISNAGCGNSLLCAGAPESCDPSKPGSCFFAGIKRTAGQNFEFSLSGESEGYIGCTLSTDSSLGGGDITFICANKDGTVEFIGASLNNSALSRKDVNANSVKGHINGNTIQCTFKATVPDATARGSATSFALAVVSGTFSPGTGDLGAPEAKVQTKVLDIADITSSISSILNSGRPTNQGLSEALLIIIVTMGLAFI